MEGIKILYSKVKRFNEKVHKVSSSYLECWFQKGKKFGANPTLPYFYTSKASQKYILKPTAALRPVSNLYEINPWPFNVEFTWGTTESFPRVFSQKSLANSSGKICWILNGREKYFQVEMEEKIICFSSIEHLQRNAKSCDNIDLKMWQRIGIFYFRTLENYLSLNTPISFLIKVAMPWFLSLMFEVTHFHFSK